MYTAAFDVGKDNQKAIILRDGAGSYEIEAELRCVRVRWDVE